MKLKPDHVLKTSQMLWQNQISLGNTIHITDFLKKQWSPTLCMLLAWGSSIPVTNMPDSSHRHWLGRCSLTFLGVPYNFFLSINPSVQHHHSSYSPSADQSELLALLGAPVGCHFSTFAQDILSGLSFLRNLTDQLHLVLKIQLKNFFCMILPRNFSQN